MKRILSFSLLLISSISAFAADYVLQKSISAGQLTPLCVPVVVTSADFDELYAIGSINGSEALIYPVASVEAGVPCVVRTSSARTSTTFSGVDISTDAPLEMPLPWDGGACTGDYANHTWTYTTLLGSVGYASQLHFSVCDLMSMDFDVTLENYNVRCFLAQTHYDFSSTSQVSRYNVAPIERRDIPNPVSLPIPQHQDVTVTVTLSQYADYQAPTTLSVAAKDGMCNVYNLIPGNTYYYKVEVEGVVVSSGKFSIKPNTLRMIYAPSVSNIRDLGGWRTQTGKHVRYGRIFRGGELNGQHVATAADVQTLKALGISAEIDLRWASRPEEDFRGISAYGFSDVDGTFYYVDGNDWLASDFDTEVTRTHLKREFEMIVTTLRGGGSIYFHCVWGADRTGFLAMLIEGALGLLPDAIFKDYELTTFSIAGLRSKQNFADRINYFNTYAGATLADRVTNYLTSRLGISKEDIDFLQQTMLE